MKFKHFSLFILVMILSLTFIISSCKKESTESNDGPTQEVRKARDVETIFAVNTTDAIEGEINNYIELNGDIKTKTEVDVYPDAMGKLHSLTVKVGQAVRKNQVIAYVDPSRPGMTYALSPVKSPISGTITSLPIKIGATVTQQFAVAKVGKLDELEIVTRIAEKFISKMKPDLKAIIKTDAHPGKSFIAKVSEISPVVDPITRMLEIKLQLEEKNKELKPGMFAEIKIITERKLHIVKIPTECMVKRYGGNYVFVIKEKLPEVITKEDFLDYILDPLSNDDDKNFLTEVYLPEVQPDKKKNPFGKKKPGKDETSDEAKFFEYDIFVLKDDISDADLTRIKKIFQEIKYDFYIVEQRKITPGIQIDNKMEVEDGLEANEQIVMRGQTLLDDTSRVRIIKKLQPLAKDDVVE